MPAPALILLIATLLPLASFALLLFVGKRMGTPLRSMGTSLAGWVGTVSIGGSFICTLVAMYQWYAAGTFGGPAWGYRRSAISLAARWIPIGPSIGVPGGTSDHPGWLDVGIYVDNLTIAMFSMVTLVALLVHIFSIGYMHGDARFPRFFTYLSLFCFSMLGLVLSSTILQIFIFWELVGFCSYLLIGFWFDRKAAARAAMKAFIVNRVGDFAFLVGFGLLVYLLGNASLPHVWAALGSAGQGHDITLANGAVVSGGMLTLIGVLLFIGAMGKSAQFPLHAWLPDAMEGPTPVSALIHAATMVAAGVYLVARLFPILTPDAKLVIATVGCITLSIGALIAMVQTDIKKVLAYSTISQLGYMMLAIGVGSWVGALFHLITHAFFKALLFLGAGSVIHAAHHEQDMRQFGGLWKRIPVTAATFGIGVLAISGVGIGNWGFAGYFSKANILTDAGAFSLLSIDGGGHWGYWLFFVVPAVVAYLTAFYMARCWMLTFWGKPRNAAVFEHARETPMIYVPLLALAVISMFAGFNNILMVQTILRGSMKESAVVVGRVIAGPAALRSAARPAPDFTGWSTAWPWSPPDAETAVMVESPIELQPSQHTHQRGREMEHHYLAWAWLAGIALAALLYGRGLGFASRIAAVRPVRWIQTWLLRAMYFDELYEILFIAPITFLGRLAGWFDRTLVDGLVTLAASSVERAARMAGWNDRIMVDGAVTGVGRSAWQLGILARSPQTGRIRLYVTALMVVIVAGIAVTVGLMVWK